MKIYIYELDFCTLGTIKEHCCEAEETQRTYVSTSGNMFPAIGLKKISKASMPRCNQHSVVSNKPLTEEQVKLMLCANRQEIIRQHSNMITSANRQIEKISRAEFERGE